MRAAMVAAGRRVGSRLSAPVVTRSLERALRHVVLPPLDAVSVYRYANAGYVESMIEQLPQARWALWALDEQHPRLAAMTLGCGPGSRTSLLNGLLSGLGRGREVEDRSLLVTDDDVVVTPGLALLVRAQVGGGFDLVQAAHSTESHAAWEFTRARTLVTMRETTFVESGPTLVFSGRGRALLLPFGDSLGMGWGTEAVWFAAARRHGLRLGIVDAVRVNHTGAIGRSYDVEAETRIATTELARLADLGVSGITDLQVTRRSWSALGTSHARRARAGR
jgi:hypothetical protein